MFLLLRPLRRLMVTALLLALVVAGIANAVILLGGRSSGGERPADAPHAQAALVLGAPVRSDGTMSAMLADRVRVAARLYREGKVGKVLASGHSGTRGEVEAMRRGLLAAGVRPRDLFVDRAGIDTLDSAYRARRVFGVDSALVVTQGFHVRRAVWLARRAGIDAHGVSADLRGYGRAGTLSQVREALARVKAVGEVVTGAEPRHLGRTIPIDGDATADRR
jgi:SanA protein